MDKGAGLRGLSRRSSRVQIPPPALPSHHKLNYKPAGKNLKEKGEVSDYKLLFNSSFLFVIHLITALLSRLQQFVLG